MMAPTAYEAVVLLVEVVVVVVEVAHGHHTLAVVLVDFAIDAVRLDARDVGIEHLADVLTHEFHHFVFDGLAFCLGCQLLHVAGVLALLFVIALVARLATLLVAGQQAVHHCVGIAAYGRREVGVVGEGQSEVSDVVDGILRLHHGAQGNGLDEFLLTLSCGRIHELVERARRLPGGAGGLQLVAEAHHKLAQFLQLRRIGHVVYAVRQRLRFLSALRFSYVFCYGAVGQQHEFLNQLIGIALPLEVGTRRAALLVDVEVQLLALEFHGTILESLVAQFLGQHVEQQQLLRILALQVVGSQLLVAVEEVGRGLARSVLHTVLLQQFLHFLVGVAAVRLDDRMHHSVRAHLGILVKQEDDAVAQFFFVGAQRAHEVAEVLGQHGDGAVDEVDRGGALLRFLVDDAAFGHVVRDVGDMDAYFIKS